MVVTECVFFSKNKVQLKCFSSAWRDVQRGALQKGVPQSMIDYFIPRKVHLGKVKRKARRKLKLPTSHAGNVMEPVLDGSGIVCGPPTDKDAFMIAICSCDPGLTHLMAHLMSSCLLICSCHLVCGSPDEQRSRWTVKMN